MLLYKGAILSAAVLVAGAGSTSIAGEAAGASDGSPARFQIEFRATIPEQRIDGLTVKGYSGLAWDEDEQVLYTVTDKGRIVHMSLETSGSTVTAISITRVERMRDVQGKPLRKRDADAEGLAAVNSNNGIKGDTELLIAIESPPQIVRYSPDGQKLGVIKLPGRLADQSSYRGPSNGLESVTLHAKLGVLTAPEERLAGGRSKLHTIYSTSGATFQLARHDLGHGNIKALDVLENGHVLVMQRTKSASTRRHQTTLRLFNPDSCSDDVVCRTQDIEIGPELLPELNFEGLTVIPGDRFALISDDESGSRHQSTLIILRPRHPAP